jgi:hypothetical protein
VLGNEFSFGFVHNVLPRMKGLRSLPFGTSNMGNQTLSSMYNVIDMLPLLESLEVNEVSHAHGMELDACRWGEVSPRIGHGIRWGVLSKKS